MKSNKPVRKEVKNRVQLQRQNSLVGNKNCSQLNMKLGDKLLCLEV
jgi:hypothetical protein